MKGFLYIFESLIAGIVIIAFLVFLNASAATKTDMNSAAYETLQGLDEQNSLRTYAEGMNASALNSRISTPGFNHSIEICSKTECVGTKPEAKNVYAATYLVAGDGSYNPRAVRLYVWR